MGNENLNPIAGESQEVQELAYGYLREHTPWFAASEGPVMRAFAAGYHAGALGARGVRARRFTTEEVEAMIVALGDLWHEIPGAVGDALTRYQRGLAQRAADTLHKERRTG